MWLKIKKNFFYLFIFFLFLNLNNAYAEINSHFGPVENYCGLSFAETQSINIGNIKKLKINIDDNKKWIKNSLTLKVCPMFLKIQLKFA